MTDRERLEEIERKLYKGHALLPVGRKWLIETLKGYIDRCESEETVESGRTTTSHDFGNATFPRT